MWIGATGISGSATALRALADVLTIPPTWPRKYEADTDDWNERERAER